MHTRVVTNNLAHKNNREYLTLYKASEILLRPTIFYPKSKASRVGTEALIKNSSKWIGSSANLGLLQTLG